MRTKYRYTIMGLLFLATTINYIDRQIIGLLKPILEVEFKWTEKDYGDIVFWFQLMYAVGFVLCTICALGYPGKKSLIDSLRGSNWAVIVVGAGAVCIEVGFLLAYRAGWRISVTGLATNVVGTLLLVPIGILIFKEHLSLRNVLGVIFCVLGLILVVRD